MSNLDFFKQNLNERKLLILSPIERVYTILFSSKSTYEGLVN